jgi:hypothetical protein
MGFSKRVPGCIDALTPCGSTPSTWFSGGGGVRVVVEDEEDAGGWCCVNDEDDNDLGWADGGGVKIDESPGGTVALDWTVSGRDRD